MGSACFLTMDSETDRTSRQDAGPAQDAAAAEQEPNGGMEK
jgi:hypothetical protein